MPTTDYEEIICKYMTIWEQSERKAPDESIMFTCTFLSLEMCRVVLVPKQNLSMEHLQG